MSFFFAPTYPQEERTCDATDILRHAQEFCEVFQSVSRCDQDSSGMSNNLIDQFFMHRDTLDGIIKYSFWTDEEKDRPYLLSMSMVLWSTPVVGQALVQPAVQV